MKRQCQSKDIQLFFNKKLAVEGDGEHITENSAVPSSSLQRSDVLLEPTSSSACADEVM